MAPKKRKAVEVDEAAAKPVPVASRRMTRSATRLASSSSSSASTVPPPELPPKKKSKKEKAKPEKKDDAEPEAEEAMEVIAEDEKEAAGDGAAHTIVIEHCKQNKLFTTSANTVKDGLQTAVPGVTVLLNPDNPRKGCFEIREQDGETFISLLDMKRPFKALKDLDMEKEIADIVEKIKS